MPFYPTNTVRRGRAASAPRAFVMPSNNPDTRGFTPPKPANDNPSVKVPKPANDNKPGGGGGGGRGPRPPRPPLPGKLARKAIRFAPPQARLIASVVEAGLRRYYPPKYDQPSMPGGWSILHGPNAYAAPYNTGLFGYAGAYENPASGTGANTGRITAQAEGRLASSQTRSSFSGALQRDPTATDIGMWENRPDLQRAASTFAFVRSPSPNWSPLLEPATRTVPAPQWFVDPFLVPEVNPGLETWPALLPMPLRRHKTNPNRRSQPEPTPGTRPKEFPAPAEPIPAKPRRPGLRPSQVPVWEVGTSTKPTTPDQGASPSRDPGTQTRPGTATQPGGASGGRTAAGPGIHTKEPPGPKVKERKGRVAKELWDALNAFGKMTEAQDMIDNAWKALPKSVRTKAFHKGQYVRPAWWKRASDVWNNWDKIDMEQFVKNVIANHIEDELIGRQSALPGGRPNPGINQFRRENRENDPTQQLPFDPDQLVNDIWERAEALAT